MTLSPVRRRFWPAIRAAFRPVPLLWTAAIIGGSIAVASLPVPGARAAATVGVLVLGGIPGRRAIRRDRALHLAEQLHARAPRRADPRTAPRPPSGSTRRRFRFVMGAAVVAVLLAGAILAATPWLADSSESVKGLPAATMWVIGPLLAAVLLFETLRDWRATRRTYQAGHGAADEEGDEHGSSFVRRNVTVLGFTGPWLAEIVVVPGEVSVAADPAEGTYDAVLACSIGLRRLDGAIPGDVLVCDGPLEPGAAVWLSDGTDGVWTARLRTVGPEELAAPWSWREAWRAAAAEESAGETHRQDRRQNRIAEGLPPLDRPRAPSSDPDLPAHGTPPPGESER